MAKMKCDVEIGYSNFIFNNSADAIAFAETALQHLKYDGDKVITITINYSEVNEEVKENED